MANNLPIAVEICRRIKELSGDIITVLGGPGVSFCAKEVLSAFPSVDFIIRGEADISFPRFINSLYSIIGDTQSPTLKSIHYNKIQDFKIEGLVFKSQNSEFVDTGWPLPVENLDKLPLPAYDFCPIQNNSNLTYSFGDYNGISIETGRGCTFDCIFCSTSHFFKRKHRLKSIDRIMKEIVYTRNRWGDQRIIFNHDILTFHRPYIESLCNEIKACMPDLTWKCHARFDTIDEALLKKMKEAGCNEIFLGIEAVTPRMQQMLNKRLDLTGFDDLILALKKLNLRFSLSFIVGIPGETVEDIKELLSYALRTKMLCGSLVVIKIHTLVPLIGSTLYSGITQPLEYDEYGSLGTSDIPLSWKKLRDFIREYPHIFTLYYHFPIGKEKRIDSCKFAMLGTAMDTILKNSMKLAYKVLGDKLAETIVNRINEIILPPAASLKDTRYDLFLESIQKLVMELLKNEKVWLEKFDTLAKFEIAAERIKKGTYFSNHCIIETFYAPEEILEEIEKFIENDTRVQLMGSKREKQYHFLNWDSEEKQIRCARVNTSLAKYLICNN